MVGKGTRQQTHYVVMFSLFYAGSWIGRMRWKKGSSTLMEKAPRIENASVRDRPNETRAPDGPSHFPHVVVQRHKRHWGLKTHDLNGRSSCLCSDRGFSFTLELFGPRLPYPAY